MIRLDIHSWVDVITNSSSVIYVIQDGQTVLAARELVSEILKLMEFPGELEDTFGIESFYETHVYEYDMPAHMSANGLRELIDNITLGGEEKPEWMVEVEQNAAHEHSKYVRIVPKHQRFIPLCRKLDNFINSPEYAEGYG